MYVVNNNWKSLYYFDSLKKNKSLRVSTYFLFFNKVKGYKFNLVKKSNFFPISNLIFSSKFLFFRFNFLIWFLIKKYPFKYFSFGLLRYFLVNKSYSFFLQLANKSYSFYHFFSRFTLFVMNDYFYVLAICLKKTLHVFKEYLLKKWIRHWIEYNLFSFIKASFYLDISKQLPFFNLFVELKPIDIRHITSQILATYICLRLKRGENLNTIVYPILRIFKVNQRRYNGVRIICAGRFTRRQRASFSMFNFGFTQQSTITNKLDYAFEDIKLKYGLCGIRVFINKK